MKTQPPKTCIWCETEINPGEDLLYDSLHKDCVLERNQANNLKYAIEDMLHGHLTTAGWGDEDEPDDDDDF